MHRQYYRFIKSTTHFSILENNVYSPHKDTKRLFACQKYYNRNGWPVEIGATPKHLFMPTAVSHNYNKYFSQQSLRHENLPLEKSGKDSSSKHMPSIVETQNDQGIAFENQLEKQFNLFEDINFTEITNEDEEKLNKFKLLMLEIDVMRQDGMKVPSKLSTDEWKELFSMESRSQKRKYLTFLFKNEMKKLGDIRKKELKRLAKLEQVQELGNDDMKYGFRGSTIFIRVYDTAINFYDNHRLIRAMMFGQDLIIDCGYYNDMNTMENRLCCKQLVYLFGENRVSKDPFNLHFCNLKKNSFLYQHLKKSIPTIEDPDFPINIYEEHYLDLFPKEKLVYLTPHCRNELKEYNQDDIYIVGAIVDRVNTQPLSLAKAKSEGLRMAQLPLDRYLDWAVGNKSLTVNQVVNIMHDACLTGNWTTALKHVPKRKVRQHDGSVIDPRKPSNRGTILKPPQRFIKYY